MLPPLPLPTLTLLPHSCLLALAQPAFLALAPHVHVHLALAAVLADVLRTLDDAAAEEALAAFAAQHVVVEAGGFVPTHTAHLIAQHLRRWALLPLQRGIFYQMNSTKEKEKKTHTCEGSTESAADRPIPDKNQQGSRKPAISQTHRIHLQFSYLCCLPHSRTRIRNNGSAIKQ